MEHTVMSNTQKTALITGASTGIGLELAKLHAGAGDNLVVVARSEDKLNNLKAELEQSHGINVTVIASDLTQPSAPQEVYDSVKQAGIEVDYLINNAGFGGLGKFHERKLEDDLQMIQLNVVALTALTRLFLPDMVARDEGKILNVSSTASLMAGPLQAVYFATKAYVTSFSNALAEELNRTNITVTTLMPGATETEFGRVSGMDKTSVFQKTASSAYSVAKDGYDAMMSGALDKITGVTLSQKIMLKMIPFAPKKRVLKQVYVMQRTDK